MGTRGPSGFILSGGGFMQYGFVGLFGVCIVYSGLYHGWSILLISAWLFAKDGSLYVFNSGHSGPASD